MNFSFYFSKKIAFSKDNKNNLSKVIIFIGRLSVGLGIIVCLITISTGLGSKKAIKNRMTDFSGYIAIKSKQSNSSYDTSNIETKTLHLDKIKQLPNVTSLQSYATISGILRTEENFTGIIFKGVGQDFNQERFKNFIIDGNVPDFHSENSKNEIILSEKIAKGLKKKVNDSILAIFSKQNEKPIYRKFVIKGIYKTDIKLIDDLFILGNIEQVRKIQNMDENQIGGVEIFLNDFNKIDETAEQIDPIIGYKNYTEKITDKYPQIVNWINIFDTNITLIISIMIIVVVIDIIMVLLILIIERTNSIGVLKTLGANNKQIRAIFIYYTLLIMIPGAVIGNAIGLGFLLLQKYFGIIKLNPENYYVNVVPVELNFVHIVMISLGFFIISGLSLLIPSYLISKISPIKSIKYN